MRRTVERFDGRILGAGTGSGVRLVVGDWDRSPLGAFTDVMVATADGRRVLLAPDAEVADYVAATYTFDEVVRCPVALTSTGTTGDEGWLVEAGPLVVHVDLGSRTVVGRVLALLPRVLSRSRVFAGLVDPLARRVQPGVRTRGSAGRGRREYYGAQDQHAVTGLVGTWAGEDLGGLADVVPAPRFGFSSTPRRPCLTRVTTTVVRERVRHRPGSRGSAAQEDQL